jgi:hypothetical protein
MALTIDGDGVVNLGTDGQVDLGDWEVTVSSGVLYFSYQGTNKAKLDSSGNLTVTGDVTAFGTV